MFHPQSAVEGEICLSTDYSRAKVQGGSGWSFSEMLSFSSEGGRSLLKESLQSLRDFVAPVGLFSVNFLSGQVNSAE